VSILPSKKFLSVFILTAAFVAAVILAFGREKSSEVINIASNLTAGDKVAIPENPNWQNELGVLNTNKVINETEGTSTKETTTDSVSRSLISNYLALKQTGKLDNTSAQKLLDQSVSYIEQSGTQVAKISESQLNIVTDISRQSIFNYGEDLGNILKRNKPASKESEMDIVTEAINSNSYEKLKELDQIITTFAKISKEMKGIPVPKQFVKAHLDMINGIEASLFGLNEVKFVINDPLKGLNGIQIYKQGITLFVQSFKATLDFIQSNSLNYKQGSGGYYLLHGI
jgi:hypothetical protein